MNDYEVKLLQKRIASLQAERDKAVELLREHVDVCLRSEAECPYCANTESFLASIGGEGKNG